MAHNFPPFEHDWGDIDSFCNQYGFYQHNHPFCIPTPIEHHPSSSHPTEKQQQQQQPNNNDLPTSNHINPHPQCTIQQHQPLSAHQILKLAGETFLQFSSHPYASSHPHLSFQDNQDVQLSHLLLDAVDKVAHHQFDTGIILLHRCQSISSNQGTPIQRIVFYFTQALMERVARETAVSHRNEKYVDACLKRNIPAFVAMHQQLPFFQVLHFTAVQTILENTRTKSKIHIIDFEVMTGIHLPVLMQAVAQQGMNPGGYLKITIIETSDKLGSEKTGKLLNSFASCLNIPFTYKVVFVADMNHLREEDLDINPEEAVAVHFPFMLRTLISKPISLRNLMNITQKIKPSIMVVAEVEGNHNSPSFVNRFIEALFFYNALFESLDESMGREDKNKMVIETGVFWEGIRNIVSTEGHERVTRSVSISVWRAFLARFGMTELELSTASIYQASLIMKQFACGKSCTLDVSTKCLIIGWKGTPLFSLSAWQFQ